MTWKHSLKSPRHAVEERDVTSLIYSHRLIHDVDTVLNGREDKEIFGAARYVERDGHKVIRSESVDSILNEIEEGSGE